MDRQIIADFILKNYPDDFTVEVKSDIEATLAIQSNQADYYVGACATGSGGALAMATGLLGPQRVASLSSPGRVLSEEQIIEAVEKGVVAFGFVNSDAERVLRTLLKAIIEKGK